MCHLYLKNASEQCVCLASSSPVNQCLLRKCVALLSVSKASLKSAVPKIRKLGPLRIRKVDAVGPQERLQVLLNLLWVVLDDRNIASTLGQSSTADCLAGVSTLLARRGYE